jgi:phosphoglycolate phosphatase-like HAD superfamily hydrolase
MDVAVVSTGSSTAEALQAASADHYLDRFSDLLKVVAG